MIVARRKRFNSEKSAKQFAKKVDGQVNDCRNNENAKSNFTVTYQPSEKTRAHASGKNNWDNSNNWCPEEDRDFGYPNWCWK